MTPADTPAATAPLIAGAAAAPYRTAPSGAGSGILRDPPGVRVIAPQQRTSVRALFGELFGHWDLLHQLAVRDVRIRYKQAVMGFAWAILMPMLIVGAGTLVRVAVVQLTGTTLPRSEIGSVVLKSFPWAFFAGALSFGVQSVTANMSLVTKIYFPRAILPIGVVVGNLFDLGVGIATTLLVLPFLGAQLSLALLWVPLLLALLVVLTAGLCTVLACANLFYRDIKYITQVMLTFGIFFTPVLFDAVAFGARGARLLMFNPLAPVFEGLRLAVMQGHNLLQPYTQVVRGTEIVAWQPWYLAYSIAWAVGSMVLGLWLFQRTQDLFAEYA
jgi:ABC-type polysaccharide/polyol phosphate export permease